MRRAAVVFAFMAAGAAQAAERHPLADAGLVRCVYASGVETTFVDGAPQVRPLEGAREYSFEDFAALAADAPSSYVAEDTAFLTVVGPGAGSTATGDATGFVASVTVFAARRADGRHVSVMSLHHPEGPAASQWYGACAEETP